MIVTRGMGDGYSLQVTRGYGIAKVIFSYTGDGEIILEGEADTLYLPFFSYTGDGEIIVEGEALTNYTRFFEYIGDGVIIVEGEAPTSFLIELEGALEVVTRRSNIHTDFWRNSPVLLQMSKRSRVLEQMLRAPEFVETITVRSPVLTEIMRDSRVAKQIITALSPISLDSESLSFMVAGRDFFSAVKNLLESEGEITVEVTEDSDVKTEILEDSEIKKWFH